MLLFTRSRDVPLERLSIEDADVGIQVMNADELSPMPQIVSLVHSLARSPARPIQPARTGDRPSPVARARTRWSYNACTHICMKETGALTVMNGCHDLNIHVRMCVCARAYTHTHTHTHTLLLPSTSTLTPRALTLLHPYSPIPLPSYTPLHPSTIYMYIYNIYIARTRAGSRC